MIRQEVKIRGPGGALAEAPLIPEGHREAEAALERGSFDEASGATGTDGEASELGYFGHHVAFPEVAERSDGKTMKRAVTELEGVAAFDALGLHPPLECTNSSRRRSGGGGGHCWLARTPVEAYKATSQAGLASSINDASNFLSFLDVAVCFWLYIFVIFLNKRKGIYMISTYFWTLQ